MQETIAAAVNDAVEITEQYINQTSAMTGMEVWMICAIAIACILIAYKITKKILSIVITLVLLLIVYVLIKQMGFI